MTTLNESRAWANAEASFPQLYYSTEQAAYDAATTDTVDLIHQRVLRFGSTRPRVRLCEEFRLTADTFYFEAAMENIQRELASDRAERLERQSLRTWAATPPSPWSRFRAWVKGVLS